MRNFLGGFLLGCLVGALVGGGVMAVAGVGRLAAPTDSEPSAAQGLQRGGETTTASASRAAPTSAADGAATGDAVVRPGAPTAGAGGPAEAAARARARARSRERTRAGSSESPADQGHEPQTSEPIVGHAARGSIDVRIQTAVEENVFDWINFEGVGDTRTRDHVGALLGGLAWGRPAPLQEGPSGAARLLAQCREAAVAHLAGGGDGGSVEARSLLPSSASGAAATAIGLADRGAVADVLAAAVGDASLGSFRYAAVLSIAERCPDDAGAAEAVITLTRESDIDLRGLAEAVLSRLGSRGQDEACDRLIAGDYHLADLVGFAPAAMAGPRRAEVIGALRDPTAVLACCAALRGADFGSDELAPLAARLPAALDPVFTSAEGQEWVGFAADVLAGVRPAALVAIAGSSRYPLKARIAAFQAAHRTAAERASLDPGAATAPLDVAADVLASADLSRDVLGTVLAAVGDEALATPRFAGLLRDLASRSRDPWAREEARRTLQRSLPRETGDLTIHAAVYGASGKEVDVADALRSRCAAGRLVEVSGNHLAGDPFPGTGKTLRVEYSNGARRLVQIVPEGQAFHLP